MISVCIPTYNGARFIKAQIETILYQIDKEDEIIISDDSSTDDTVQIIRSFNDPRIKIFNRNSFGSPIFNLENALKQASGEYIFLSDQDDVWKENKVEVIKPLLSKYNTVVSDCNLINEYGDEISSSFFELNDSGPGLIRNLLKNSYLGCCMAFDRRILNASLPFPSSIAMHDIWIGLVSEIFGKTLFLEEKLISYRRHGANYSPTSQVSQLSVFLKISYRLRLINQAIFRFFRVKLQPN